MSKVLRPYQEQAIQTLWTGFRTKPRQLCTLPTGSGKSFIITEICKRLAAVNYKSVLLLNRELLVEQFARDMSFLPFGVYAAGFGEKNKSQTITISMIQSCHKQIFEDAKVIIVDEAHSINEEGMYTRFIEAHPNAKILGFTATPYNTNGYIYGKDKFFPNRDFFRTLKSMISDGYLVPPKSVCPINEQFDTSQLRVRGDDYVLEDLTRLVSDTKKATKQVFDALSRLTDRKKVIWVCLNVEHAEIVKKEIEKFEKCAIIHSKQKTGVQEAYREIFERGSCRHMVSVMMMTEGYDHPAVDAIVILRPTKSARLYVQIVGRGLRLSEGKTDCKVLDYGEVIKNLGSVFDPFVEKDRKRKANDENEQTIFFASSEKLCKNCFSLMDIKSRVCLDCGSESHFDYEKNLKEKAAARDIIMAEREVVINRVMFYQHESSAGNKCVKISYQGNLMTYSQYFTAHPFSWGKCRPVMKELTGWDFDVFDECYDNLNELIVEKVPESVSIKRDGKYDRITKITFKDKAIRS